MASRSAGGSRTSRVAQARAELLPEQRGAGQASGGEPERRWGIYVRISKADQDDPEKRTLGVERQEKDVRALLKRRDGTIVEPVYSDNDKSAYKGKKRPAYEQMIRDLVDGRINGVAVYNIDRLTRRPLELEQFLELAEKHDIIVANVTGDVDLTTPYGLGMARMRATWARMASDEQSMRIKRKNVELREKGKLLGGGLRYGWTGRSCAAAKCTVEDCKKIHTPLVLHPEQAMVIKEATKRIIAGESLRSLTLDLNSRGLFNVRGNAWDRRTLKVMLCRARNAGLIEHREKRGGPMMVVGKAKDWKPIVTRKQWEAVNKILSADGPPSHQQNSKVKNLLSFIATCGTCGDAMIAGKAVSPYTLADGTKKRSERRIYKCRGEVELQLQAQAQREGKTWERRSHPSRTQADIDLYVTEYVLTRLEHAQPEELLRVHLDEEQALIESKIQEIEERLQRMSAMWGAGSLDEANYLAASRAAYKELDKWALLREPVRQEQVLRDFLGDQPVRAVWQALELDRKRAVIRTLCSRLVIHSAGRGNHRNRPLSETVTIDA